MLRVDKSNYPTTGAIAVDFDGFSGSETDWISTALVGSPLNVILSFKYTGGGVSGAVTFNNLAEANLLEARAFFDWPSGGYMLQQSSPAFFLSQKPPQLTEYFRYFNYFKR